MAKLPSLRYMICWDVCVPLNPCISSAVSCSGIKPALMNVFGLRTSTTFPRFALLHSDVEIRKYCENLLSKNHLLSLNNAARGSAKL